MTWFAYDQWVLQKVHIDRSLFRKELHKLLSGLTRVERLWLLDWRRISLFSHE